MAKSRDKSEVERLKGIIRQQKSIIRNLTKEVGRANKKHNREAELETELQEYMLREEQESKQDEVKTGKGCPKCNSKLAQTDLGVKILNVCNDCGHKFTVKK